MFGCIHRNVAQLFGSPKKPSVLQIACGRGEVVEVAGLLGGIVDVGFCSAGLLVVRELRGGRPSVVGDCETLLPHLRFLTAQA
uniref:Uncharacterized protein n=1 Tax=Glossina palpalis gambiensis TaxID=67801 RepID=A0A1B0BWG8_9MUSC